MRVGNDWGLICLRGYMVTLSYEVGGIARELCNPELPNHRRPMFDLDATWHELGYCAHSATACCKVRVATLCGYMFGVLMEIMDASMRGSIPNASASNTHTALWIKRK
jgi:hypothetical protein